MSHQKESEKYRCIYKWGATVMAVEVGATHQVSNVISNSLPFSLLTFFLCIFLFHPSFVESIFPDVCLCNACNLCNGNMSEYPMTHPQPPPTQELSHGHIYFTFQWCYEFALVFCFYYLTIKRQLSKNSWSMETKTNSSIFAYVCVCVCVDPPEIVEKPKDVAVRSGGIAAFYCRARGEPTPQLSWRKNGRKVREYLYSFFLTWKGDFWCNFESLLLSSTPIISS